MLYLYNQDTEVIITQYVRPDGHKRICYAEVGKKHAEMAKNMVLSAEVMVNGDLMIYCKKNN